MSFAKLIMPFPKLIMSMPKLTKLINDKMLYHLAIKIQISKPIDPSPSSSSSLLTVYTFIVTWYTCCLPLPCMFQTWGIVDTAWHNHACTCVPLKLNFIDGTSNIYRVNLNNGDRSFILIFVVHARFELSCHFRLIERMSCAFSYLFLWSGVYSKSETYEYFVNSFPCTTSEFLVQ